MFACSTQSLEINFSFNTSLFYCSLGSVGLVNAGDINLGVSDFKCPTGYTVYPHPQQCELYYTCYNTQPTYLYQCRGNLLFDLVYDGCNWPEQTYCGNRTRPDQTTGKFLSSIDDKKIYQISNSTCCLMAYSFSDAQI